MRVECGSGFGSSEEQENGRGDIRRGILWDFWCGVEWELFTDREAQFGREESCDSCRIKTGWVRSPAKMSPNL